MLILVDGLVEQWSNAQIASTSSSQTFSFNIPVTMSDFNYFILLNLQGDASKDHTTTIEVKDKNLSGFTLLSTYCHTSYGWYVRGY